MSVPVSKREESKFLVITNAKKLAIHTINICKNEKYFPKRYRWCLTNKIVDCAVEIVMKLVEANSLFPNSKAVIDARLANQRKALSLTHSMLSLLELAKDIFNMDCNKMEYWVGLIKEEQRLIYSWIKSDQSRFHFNG